MAEQNDDRKDRPYRAMPDRGTVEDNRRANDRTNERIDRLLKRIEYVEDWAESQGLTFPPPQP